MHANSENVRNPFVCGGAADPSIDSAILVRAQILSFWPISKETHKPLSTIHTGNSKPKPNGSPRGTVFITANGEFSKARLGAAKMNALQSGELHNLRNSFPVNVIRYSRSGRGPCLASTSGQRQLFFHPDGGRFDWRRTRPFLGCEASSGPPCEFGSTCQAEEKSNRILEDQSGLRRLGLLGRAPTIVVAQLFRSFPSTRLIQRSNGTRRLG
jgi:hypothetical protein